MGVTPDASEIASFVQADRRTAWYVPGGRPTRGMINHMETISKYECKNRRGSSRNRVYMKNILIPSRKDPETAPATRWRILVQSQTVIDTVDKVESLIVRCYTVLRKQDISKQR